jgi:hypothetical protein
MQVQLGEDTEIEIRESNTDRLGPSVQYGAPIDFDRLAEPLPSLLASALRRTCAAAGVSVRDVTDALLRQSQGKEGTADV